MNAWSVILRSLAAIALLAYPALVYFGMSSGSPRQVSLVLLLVMAPALILRLRKSSQQAVRGLVAVPITIISILLIAAALDGTNYILATPVAANVVLLIAFGSTLRRGTTVNRDNREQPVMPMIERFARLQNKDLSPDKQAWCRMWTWLWCAFFIANGTTALLFAMWATMKWWALYNGLLCYGLIGIMFATEWLLRRRRFPDLQKPRASR